MATATEKNIIEIIRPLGMEAIPEAYDEATAEELSSAFTGEFNRLAGRRPLGKSEIVGVTGEGLDQRTLKFVSDLDLHQLDDGSTIEEMGLEDEFIVEAPLLVPGRDEPVVQRVSFTSTGYATSSQYAHGVRWGLHRPNPAAKKVNRTSSGLIIDHEEIGEALRATAIENIHPRTKAIFGLGIEALKALQPGMISSPPTDQPS